MTPDASAEPRTDVDDRGLTPGQVRAERLARILVIPLAVVLGVLVLVFFVLFDYSKVDGPSMIPTLRDQEYVLVTKGASSLARGDIVVLDVPADRAHPEWIKRVVGLPGDRVTIVGNRAWVNGAREPFAHGIVDDGRTSPTGEVVVPSGYVFVMGDNRPGSLDSRVVGPFPRSAVRGKAVAVYAPISRLRLIPHP